MIIYQAKNSIENYAYNCYIYNNCEWAFHFHKNYELIYVIDGELEATVDGRSFRIQKNEFSLILPNNIHHLHTPVSSKVWIGVFSADYIKSFDDFMKDKANAKTVFCADKKLMPYIKKLLTTEIPHLFTMQSILYAICSEYVKVGEFYTYNRDTNDLPIRIYEYTKDNFNKDISLKTIAADLGYDYHYISRVFHSVFHMNFRGFLNQFRLDYALNRLKSGISITELAFESGFGSVRTLNRSFKAVYGKSPKDMIKK